MNSIWWDVGERVHFESLKGNIRTDALVIGGGMAGLLCAHMLKNAGVDCVVVEAKRICQGVTANTTAKITWQHGLLYHKLMKQLGREKAQLYLRSQHQAVRTFTDLCQTLDCDYERKPSYVYSLDDRAKIEKEVACLQSLGARAMFCERVDLPFRVAGAVRVEEQAQFHPLKFAYGVAKGLTVYENTKVLQLMPGKAITNGGEIRCRKIIVATHFPILNKHGSYFLKLYQHRSYVIALEGARRVDGMFVDENEKGMSFRDYGKLLLLGGGAHRTGKKGGNWDELVDFAKKQYPTAAVTAKWATQDCMTLDGIPYVGQYASSTPDLYVATGFNKWGMSGSMSAAILLADLITGKQSEYAALVSPSRSMLHPQLAVNAFESVVGLLTPTAPRCPHLGCALKYNSKEHSWDCPCHGSRFTEEGELINNPATDDKANM